LKANSTIIYLWNILIVYFIFLAVNGTVFTRQTVRNQSVKRPIHSQLNRAIVLRDIIPDGKN